MPEFVGRRCHESRPFRGRQCPQYGRSPRLPPSRPRSSPRSSSPASLPAGPARAAGTTPLQVSRELTATATDIATLTAKVDARADQQRHDQLRDPRRARRSDGGDKGTRQDLHRQSEQPDPEDSCTVDIRSGASGDQPGAGLDQRPDRRHRRRPPGEEGVAARPARGRLHFGRRLGRSSAARRRRECEQGTETPGAVEEPDSTDVVLGRVGQLQRRPSELRRRQARRRHRRRVQQRPPSATAPRPTPAR